MITTVAQVVEKARAALLAGDLPLALAWAESAVIGDPASVDGARLDPQEGRWPVTLLNASFGCDVAAPDRLLLGSGQIALLPTLWLQAAQNSVCPFRPPMPRTLLPDARISPRFAGIATFCRYPRMEDVLAENRPIDWAIFGVPFDGGVTYRPGARFGPRAIREESQYIKRYSLEHKVDVCEVLSIADAGDAPVSPYDVRATLDLVGEFATTIDEPGPPHAKLLAVGGDHCVAYANLRATYARRGEPAGGLAVIHFDSHLDTIDEVWGNKWGHASPFRRAIEEGLVNPAKMISVGLKGPLNNASDLEFASHAGITLVTQESLDGAGGRQAVADFGRALGEHPAYVTFDVDVVDPAFAPGTGTPCCGGLSSAQAFALLRSLRGINIVGGDVVEVLPDRDVAGITALLAGQVIFELLALDAVRRGRGD